MLGDRNVYVNPAREIPTTLGVDRAVEKVSEPDYPNVWGRLDEMDVCLHNLREQLDNLEVRLGGIMSATESYPVPGPRGYNSDLTGRICNQLDYVDDMIRKISDIRDRLTV